VFCYSDLVASGAIHTLLQRGLRVPEDVAIIGYDDISFAASAAVPLSSIRQPRVDLGRRAAELLFDEIEADDDDLPHEHQNVRFTPSLVVRRSTVGSSTGRHSA
jgi:LacI family transcriptional regulator